MRLVVLCLMSLLGSAWSRKVEYIVIQSNHAVCPRSFVFFSNYQYLPHSIEMDKTSWTYSSTVFPGKLVHFNMSIEYTLHSQEYEEMGQDFLDSQ